MEIAYKISKVMTRPLTLSLPLCNPNPDPDPNPIPAPTLPQPYPNPNPAPVTYPQVKTVRDNPVEPIKMLKITVEGLEKDDL